MNTLSYSWGPEILAVKHLPLEVIPRFCKRGDNDFESVSVVMRYSPFNVFKIKNFGCLSLSILGDFKEKVSSCVIKSSAFPSNAKACVGNLRQMSHGQGFHFVGTVVMSLVSIPLVFLSTFYQSVASSFCIWGFPCCLVFIPKLSPLYISRCIFIPFILPKHRYVRDG